MEDRSCRACYPKISRNLVALLKKLPLAAVGRNSGEGGKSNCRDEVPTTAVEGTERRWVRGTHQEKNRGVRL